MRTPIRRPVRWSLLVIAVAALASLVVPARPADAALLRRYVTVVISKTAGQEASANCVALPGTVPTLDTAAALKQRGISVVTGSLVVKQADNADRGLCTLQKAYDGTPGGITKSEGWAMAAKLRDRFNWKFVSHSATYPDMTALTPEQMQAESCGTLPTFKAHGHTSAWGMFNYPNNRFSGTTDTVVNPCFAYTRSYVRDAVNTLPSVTRAPYRANTRSVNGGKCNNALHACFNYGPVVGNTRYVVPSAAAQILRPLAGQWGIAQWYRFVTGSRPAGSAHAAWDCTSANPNNHWTSDAELYCWNDFLAAVSGRDKSAVVTHPAAMAQVWKR